MQMSHSEMVLLRTSDGISICRDGTCVKLTSKEVRWLVRNLPVMLKVGEGEKMRAIDLSCQTRA